VITFEQGVSDDGRRYLQCGDNGIGMSDVELRGAFSRVGVCFTGSKEFVEEKAQWDRCGIKHYPIGRFGIGGDKLLHARR
jgi:HSP90 family molecular chaperone